MAAITELNAAAQTEFVKLRHKYLNGSSEIIQTSAGVLSTGTFPDTSFSTAVTGKGFLQDASVSGARELVLQSASEAAQFQVGDTLHCFTTAGAADFTAVTVEGVKGQKVLVSATDAAGTAGSLCVKFATGQVGGQAADQAAGIAYVGAGDVAAFLQAIQNNMTAIMYTGTANVDSTATAVGIYSTLTTALTIPTDDVSLMNDDLITFTADSGAAALVGCTCRIIKHEASGGAEVITVGDIRDSNGTFLGNQFPVVTTSAHSGGASASVSPTAAATFTIQAGKADKYIRQLSGSTNYPAPESQGGVENSNDSGATTVLINALFEMMQHFVPSAGEGNGDQELIPADLEEKLFGCMVKGSVTNLGTAQGKRLRITDAVAATDTSFSVDMDNAINDISFPLSGTVRVHTNRGVGNDQGINGCVISSDIPYTRTKRSNLLTLTQAVSNYDGAATGFGAGDVCELVPAHGMIKKPYASEVSGEDVVTIMMAMRNCLKTIPAITVA